MAGFEIKSLHRLDNKYWPQHQDYFEVRKNNPWWLAITPHGPIEIGWRKRVISISWADTPLQYTVTEDDVTKSKTLVHAWSYAKALEYLDNLACLIAEDRIAAVCAARDAARAAQDAGSAGTSP